MATTTTSSALLTITWAAILTGCVGLLVAWVHDIASERREHIAHDERLAQQQAEMDAALRGDDSDDYNECEFDTADPWVARLTDEEQANLQAFAERYMQQSAEEWRQWHW